VTSARSLSDGLSHELVRRAARRLRIAYPDWAEAVLAEHVAVEGGMPRLVWAAGVWIASLSVVRWDRGYAAALVGALTIITAYQWSADESMKTVVLICSLSLGLGALRPQAHVVTGLVVGAVVGAVNAFETLTGIHPGYEAVHHSLARLLAFIVFIPPALVASTLGRRISLAVSDRLERSPT
jgi:hypothetical protein